MGISSRWWENFQELLNWDTTVELETINQIPQHSIMEHLGDPPTENEVLDAIRKLSNNKASGPDGIPAEILKQGGPKLCCHIHNLLCKIWDKEEIPAELRDALIVTIFKKGDEADCGSYRGISLLSTTGKVLARIQLATTTVRNLRHDFYSSTTAGKMLGTTPTTVHGVHRSNEGL